MKLTNLNTSPVKKNPFSTSKLPEKMAFLNSPISSPKVITTTTKSSRRRITLSPTTARAMMLQAMEEDAIENNKIQSSFEIIANNTDSNNFDDDNKSINKEEISQPNNIVISDQEFDNKIESQQIIKGHNNNQISVDNNDDIDNLGNELDDLLYSDNSLDSSNNSPSVVSTPIINHFSPIIDKYDNCEVIEESVMVTNMNNELDREIIEVDEINEIAIPYDNQNIVVVEEDEEKSIVETEEIIFETEEIIVETDEIIVNDVTSSNNQIKEVELNSNNMQGQDVASLIESMCNNASTSDNIDIDSLFDSLMNNSLINNNNNSNNIETIHDTNVNVQKSETVINQEIETPLIKEEEKIDSVCCETSIEREEINIEKHQNSNNNKIDIELETSDNAIECGIELVIDNTIDIIVEEQNDVKIEDVIIDDDFEDTAMARLCVRFEQARWKYHWEIASFHAAKEAKARFF
jgi:hypothetical protein